MLRPPPTLVVRSNPTEDSTISLTVTVGAKAGIFEF